MSEITIRSSLAEWLSDRAHPFESLVLDIDGVLMMEGKPVRGSDELMETIRANAWPLMLLTNDAQHSVEEKHVKLHRHGIDVFPDEIVSCGDGLADWARDHPAKQERLFLMGTLGNPCYAKKAGLDITRDTGQLPDCRGVIVGEGAFDWHQAINSTLNFFLSRPDALLIVPNPDEVFPVEENRVNVGPGAIARFMQRILSSLGVPLEPVYLGKPYPPIFQTAHRRLEQKRGKELDRSRVLMIGDLLESDIRGARDFGYGSALVLSGVTNEAMLRESPLLPDFVFRAL